MSRVHFLVVLGAAWLHGTISHADEGMWLYNQPPKALLKGRYGFEPSAAWLDHLQKSSANVGGASGAFVSRKGLLLSNQHVVSRTLQRMSTASRNITRDGFCAGGQKEELPCPGLEVSVLVEVEDVTDAVNAAVQEGMSDEAAFLARRAAMAVIEKKSNEQTGLRSQVVTLFQGGQYHLYRSRRYTDVRLVMTPEEQIAFFGGDVDNFEFPRWNLDIAFLRAYENGKPAEVQHWLEWNAKGAVQDELVFMSGHPARTDRLRTVAELKHLRDVEYPRALERLKRTEVLLAAYSKESAENARRARSDLRSVENGRKRRDGTLAALMDPALFERKSATEKRLRSAAEADASLAASRDAWDRIEQAQQEISAKYREYDHLEVGSAFNTSLFTHARRLVRAATELQKPEGERLEEYRPSSLVSLELALGAEQPYYEDLEALKLADSLTWFAEEYGRDHPLVQEVLNGKSPRTRARECVSGTKLTSAAVRRQLFSSPQRALQAKDPMLELARLIDPAARALRSRIEVLTETIRQAHARIGRVRNSLQGEQQYPDATGTLRFAFGTIDAAPGEDADGAPYTIFKGLYARANEHDFEQPFDLPSNWVRVRRKLDLGTPMNFVSTCDTLGGNSGSPVVNRRGELVGVVFDGNIHSLILDVEYNDEMARSVAVHSAGILEGLRKAYRCDWIIRELTGRQK